MDGSKEFRFISVNTPSITVINDPYWHLTDAWEQEDALKTISILGGKVIRTYTLSILKKTDKPGTKRHVYAPGKYDEEFFRGIDKLLSLCNTHNIRVIIPFIDRWHWWGGIDDFKAFRKASDFYTNKQVIQDFKNLITYVLNRENVYTKVKYKDDKSILAWETGNELNSPTVWTREIAKHIKSIDKNHLVLDGKYGIDPSSLNDPNIDIVSNHYYGDHKESYAQRCKNDRGLAKNKKPFIVGEYGLAETKIFKDLLKEVISDGTSGALIWSLRQHNRIGGFYKHREGKRKYQAYHWPGFKENNEYDEIEVMKMIREKAYEISHIFTPTIKPPISPILLDNIKFKAINWKGSVGADRYDISRATDKNGPWNTIEINISDCKQVEKEGPLFEDKSVVPGRRYYYRVMAKNSAGSSDWSNIVGPISS